jgi:Txe/YoeB family toxin of Txe-Axe toxin-antitoxin module
MGAYTGGGLDTAIKVGTIGKNLVGAIKDPISGIVNAGFNLFDWHNQIQGTERAIRDVNEAARQQVQAHAVQSLPKTREEAQAQHTFFETLQNPTKGLQGAKFKALKAEAIRQLQAEGKTPREVEEQYHQRIQELQKAGQPVALNITAPVMAEWTPENQAEYDYYQQAKQDLASQRNELINKNPIQVALGMGRPPSLARLIYDKLLEKSMEGKWSGYDTSIVVDYVAGAEGKAVAELFHEHGYNLNSPYPLKKRSH